MKKTNHITSEKGMALIWSLVTISVLLIISTSMGEMVAKDIRMTGDMVSSQKAYSAAESGFRAAELRKSKADTQDYEQNDIKVDPTDTPTFSYKIHKDGNKYNIESTGKADTITRKIERTITELGAGEISVGSYTTDPSLDVASDKYRTHPIFPFVGNNINTINTIADNYTQEFRVYTAGASFDVMMGASNDYDISESISVQFANTGTTLLVGGVSKNMDFTPVSNTNYKVVIDYKKNTAVTASIYEINASSGVEVETCMKKVMQTVSNISPSFNKILYASDINGVTVILSSPFLKLGKYVYISTVSVRRY